MDRTPVCLGHPHIQALVAQTWPRTCRRLPGGVGKRWLSCRGHCAADASLPSCFLHQVRQDSSCFESHLVPMTEKPTKPWRFWPRHHRATELGPGAAHLWMCSYVSRTNVCSYDTCSRDIPSEPICHAEGAQAICGRLGLAGPLPAACSVEVNLDSPAHSGFLVTSLSCHLMSMPRKSPSQAS